ncbi:MAG: hypothetical protein O2897_06090, partial [bacterium]|nr:hypothetical protein [bacterium]
MRKYLSAALILTLFLCSCPFGSAIFVSEIKNFDFNPDCTVFAYEDNLTDDGTTSVVKQLHINMSWACFDPKRDLLDLLENDLNLLIAEFQDNDALTFTFSVPVALNKEYLTNATPIFSAWMQIAKSTEKSIEVKQDLLIRDMQVTLTNISKDAVSGIMQTKAAFKMLKATFNAPILSADEAKIAVANWHLLKGTKPKVTPPPAGQS